MAVTLPIAPCDQAGEERLSSAGLVWPCLHADAPSPVAPFLEHDQMAVVFVKCAAAAMLMNDLRHGLTRKLSVNSPCRAA